MGIGRALARGSAVRGVNLVLNARTRKPLEEIGRKLAEKGSGIEVHLAFGNSLIYLSVMSFSEFS